ncbi:unnamed protein product [Phytophthora fragariaefolia]|uniref:Unnamed protein product n=1 Tax=Phytophthora fragariaefolia TaxID=1490495 RepID=A0A9W6Y7L6_9STRA|nr:unnamed protein product [Phytophthora fragariaefolia]
MIQANLNHTPVPSLGNKAPVELFTGLRCPTPLRGFYRPDKGGLQEVPASERIDEYLDELRSSLHAMHYKVEDRRLQQRLLNKKRERGENLVNFAVGDYVLRSRVDEKHGNKLQVTWVGPYRVVRADAHSFRVQHLVTGDELDVHASRLKMYADSSLDVTDELLDHESSQGIILAIEDSYEPVKSLAKEIRVLVDNYATHANGPKFKEYWNKMKGVVMEPMLSLPPTRYQPPADQQPRASQDAVDQPQRRKTSRKRRRRQPAAVAATSKVGATTAARVLPSAPTRRPRRAQDEDGQQHTGTGDQGSQPPLGSRTRSSTSAAPTSATGASSLEPASKRARRQQRSRSTTLLDLPELPCRLNKRQPSASMAPRYQLPASGSNTSSAHGRLAQRPSFGGCGRRDHRLPLDAPGVSDGSQPVTRGLRIRQVWLSVPDLSCMWNFVYSACPIAKGSSIGRSVSHFNPCWRDASGHDEVVRLSEGLVSISP